MLRRNRPLGQKARESRPIAAKHHLDRGKSDGHACDNTESRNENGYRQNEQQESEATFLEVPEKPIEIDAVLWRLLDEAREQMGSMNLFTHANYLAGAMAIIGKTLKTFRVKPESSAELPSESGLGLTVLESGRPCGAGRDRIENAASSVGCGAAGDEAASLGS